MKENKFELFMCCMGNGTVICNKAVTEHGDYKQIAHISEHGHIKFYVSENYIPEDAMKKIKKVAEADKQKFLKEWNKKTYYEKWGYMMDIPTIGCGYNAVSMAGKENKHLSMKKRVELMEKLFFEMHM